MSDKARKAGATIQGESYVIGNWHGQDQEREKIAAWLSLKSGHEFADGNDVLARTLRDLANELREPRSDAATREELEELARQREHKAFAVLKKIDAEQGQATREDD
jgi:hypothetical protein